MVFWCRELGFKNKDHNFWTWIGENIRIFLDKMLDLCSTISSIFPPYFSCSCSVPSLFTQQKKKKKLCKLPTLNTKLRENSNLCRSLLPSFRLQSFKDKSKHFSYSKKDQIPVTNLKNWDSFTFLVLFACTKDHYYTHVFLCRSKKEE